MQEALSCWDGVRRVRCCARLDGPHDCCGLHVPGEHCGRRGEPGRARGEASDVWGRERVGPLRRARDAQTTGSSSAVSRSTLPASVKAKKSVAWGGATAASDRRVSQAGRLRLGAPRAGRAAPAPAGAPRRRAAPPPRRVRRAHLDEADVEAGRVAASQEKAGRRRVLGHRHCARSGSPIVSAGPSWPRACRARSWEHDKAPPRGARGRPQKPCLGRRLRRAAPGAPPAHRRPAASCSAPATPAWRRPARQHARGAAAAAPEAQRAKAKTQGLPKFGSRWSSPRAGATRQCAEPQRTRRPHTVRRQLRTRSPLGKPGRAQKLGTRFILNTRARRRPPRGFLLRAR